MDIMHLLSHAHEAWEALRVNSDAPAKVESDERSVAASKHEDAPIKVEPEERSPAASKREDEHTKAQMDEKSVAKQEEEYSESELEHTAGPVRDYGPYVIEWVKEIGKEHATLFSFDQSTHGAKAYVSHRLAISHSPDYKHAWVFGNLHPKLKVQAKTLPCRFEVKWVFRTPSPSSGEWLIGICHHDRAEQAKTHPPENLAAMPGFIGLRSKVSCDPWDQQVINNQDGVSGLKQFDFSKELTHWQPNERGVLAKRLRETFGLLQAHCDSSHKYDIVLGLDLHCKRCTAQLYVQCTNAHGNTTKRVYISRAVRTHSAQDTPHFFVPAIDLGSNGRMLEYVGCTVIVSDPEP